MVATTHEIENEAQSELNKGCLSHQSRGEVGDNRVGRKRDANGDVALCGRGWKTGARCVSLRRPSPRAYGLLKLRDNRSALSLQRSLRNASQLLEVLIIGTASDVIGVFTQAEA